MKIDGKECLSWFFRVQPILGCAALFIICKDAPYQEALTGFKAFCGYYASATIPLVPLWSFAVPMMIENRR